MTYKGEWTILDLDNEIRRRLKEQVSDADETRINQLKKLRKKRKAENYKAGARKREIRKKLKDEVSEEEIKFRLAKVPTTPLSHIDNEINRLEKKDFYYIINDKFNPPYKIHVSEIEEEGDLSKIILDKYLKKIEKGFDEGLEDPNVSLKKMVALEKLVKNVRFNKEILETGERDYPEVMQEEVGEYPIFVDFFGENIELSTT